MVTCSPAVWVHRSESWLCGSCTMSSMMGHQSWLCLSCNCSVNAENRSRLVCLSSYACDSMRLEDLLRLTAGFEGCVTTDCLLPSSFPPGTCMLFIGRLSVFPHFHLFQGIIRQESTTSKCSIFATQKAFQPAALVSHITVSSANIMSICLHASSRKVRHMFSRLTRTGCQQGLA